MTAARKGSDFFPFFLAFIAYDAAAACIVDATARGEQAAFTLVALA
jgi:hypothetical protein